MSTPAQMFDHELNPVKGWPSPYAVDKAADLSGDDGVLAGQVLSLDADANFQLGLAENAMAIFAWNSSTDHDVVSDDGGMVGGEDGAPHMSGLVAAGSYELESTEFDAEQVYVPNQALTSALPGVAGAGDLTPGDVFVDTVCGVTSDGVVANERAKDVLRFWPQWLPVIA